MPRRSAPTPLRLVQGPLPKRGEPKHTLPSLPRPAFHPPSRVSQGPVPRERSQVYATTADREDSGARASVAQLVPALPTGAVSPTSAWFGSSGGSKSRGHSRESSTSSSSSRRNSRSSRESSRTSSLDEENADMAYGPWVTNVKTFGLPFDPSTLIMPPQPAAINPVPVW
ncbi:hypothetical protein FOMPIDRAFT_1021255 [Fomitopsis schrenkii]|uniref:Uncharacterized protein n=1 Tax=Fomitopsis schrenkii TaxID=2126942 RepID=S8G5A6_FOMSC|nr:hypothetical protein FOMPIDRAFT_1021255 [Fomitopsis schrenkii]